MSWLGNGPIRGRIKPVTNRPGPQGLTCDQKGQKRDIHVNFSLSAALAQGRPEFQPLLADFLLGRFSICEMDVGPEIDVGLEIDAAFDFEI